RRLRRRSALRAGARQVAGALRLRDRREHDPADHVRPRPGDARKQSSGFGVSGSAGPSQADRRRDGRRHGSDRRAEQRGEGHAQGNCTPVYAGSIEGGVEEAGRQLLSCAVRAGFGANSRVHAVGDGAPWIVGQIEQQFGDQGCYLIDFYHVCEYLGAASAAIAPDPAARSAWMETQKEALKGGRLDAVLRALVGHCEPPQADDQHAPVRTCHRYLGARADQLNYRQALAAGLPIGSGEIESAHRYVAQQRLKRPGAWWRVEHAEHMLALRINRINGDWDAYWKALTLQRAVAANDNSPNKSLRRTACLHHFGSHPPRYPRYAFFT